jgi:hypothetical protein
MHILTSSSPLKGRGFLLQDGDVRNAGGMHAVLRTSLSLADLKAAVSRGEIG